MNFLYSQATFSSRSKYQVFKGIKLARANPHFVPYTFMATNKIDGRVQRSEKHTDRKQRQDECFDYSPRGQWLRAAVLGATDGLVFVACLMMGFRGGKDVKTKFVMGVCNLVAGTISIAIREYVSVYSQLDIELAQAKREKRMIRNQDKQQLPNPMRAAIAASVAFALGGVGPLFVGSFISDHEVKLGVLVAIVAMELLVFGWIWSVIGGTPVWKSCFRVLFGGLVAFGIAFGQTFIGSGGV